MGASPPFTGVAVNVTAALLHILKADEAILIDGTVVLPVVRVMLLLVAVAGTVHEEELVMMTFTTLLFDNVEELKVGLFVPTLLPLTCH